MPGRPVTLPIGLRHDRGAAFLAADRELDRAVVEGVERARDSSRPARRTRAARRGRPVDRSGFRRRSWCRHWRAWGVSGFSTIIA